MNKSELFFVTVFGFLIPPTKCSNAENRRLKQRYYTDQSSNYLNRAQLPEYSSISLCQKSNNRHHTAQNLFHIDQVGPKPTVTTYIFAKSRSSYPVPVGAMGPTSNSRYRKKICYALGPTVRDLGLLPHLPNG